MKADQSLFFAIFLVASLIGSVVNHIDDTDETYGYWEPLHYLLFGTGMQTWEYAPQYAIRTYSFICPFYLLSAALVKLGLTKVAIFRIVRSLIGVFTAYSESAFLSAISINIGSDVASITCLFMLFSPGLFFCATSYLPSAVCTSLLMLSCAAWLQQHFIKSIFWGCVAVLCTGWPFCGLLFLPLGIHMVCSIFMTPCPCSCTSPSSIPSKSTATATAMTTTAASVPPCATHATATRTRRKLIGLIGVLQLAASGVALIVAIQLLVFLLDYQYYNKW